MPKIKTHKSTAKRFKYSSTGKLMRMRQGKGHLRRKKTTVTVKADHTATPMWTENTGAAPAQSSGWLLISGVVSEQTKEAE